MEAHMLNNEEKEILDILKRNLIIVGYQKKQNIVSTLNINKDEEEYMKVKNWLLKKEK